MPNQFDLERDGDGAGQSGRRALPTLPVARRPRRWRDELLGVGLAFVLGAGAVVAYPLLGELAMSLVAPRGETRIAGLVRDPFPPDIPRFTLCWQPRQQDCVVDGDTLRFSGMTVRMADIDAPEATDFACPQEKILADRATAELLRIVNEGPFEVVRSTRDADVHGRKLRVLTRDGVSIGARLVAAGLARHWEGTPQSWC